MKTEFSKLVRFHSLLAVAVWAVMFGTVGMARAQSQLDIQPTPTLTVTGTPDACEIQWAPAAGTSSWSLLKNLSLSTSPATLADTTAGSAPQRFYRVLAGSSDTRLELQMRMTLTVSGAAGTHEIGFYENRVWTVLTNVVLVGGPVSFEDATTPANGRHRYYYSFLSLPNPDPPHFVWINSGTFTMGSPDGEPDRRSDESPQTVVKLTRGFWMGKYGVTQEEYQAVMGANPSYHKRDTNLPVETVTWYDATNYCGRLTESERLAGRLPVGWMYRLPTEAEREYAARAGTWTRFSYGDDLNYGNLSKYAWWWINSAGQTHPVGQKLANPWGLYDMHGNVWEWCLDWYGGYPGGNATDPKGPTTGSLRVARGGSSVSMIGIDNPYFCRSAFRNAYPPDARNEFVGFRVVLARAQP